MPALRTLLPALAVVAAALVPAACGGSDSESEEGARPAPAQTTERRPAAPSPSGGPERQAIAAVLERYAEAIRRRDARTICEELMSRAVRRVVSGAGGDCERDLINPAIARGGRRYRLVLQGLVVRGDRATARTRVTDRDSTQSQMQPLVRERGEWKLTSPQAERAAG